MSIRKRIASDNHELVEIWNRSVRATHTFLDEKDIQDFYVQVRDVYLPCAGDEVWIYETNSSTTTTTTTTIAGFIAMNGAHVNMLFIDPAYRGQGIGTKLLDHVKSILRCDSAVMISVDVNEQNPQAHGFYLHYGFKDVGRSELDSTGRPFPLIHMSLLL